jgi:archaellum component FlaC
MDRQRILLFAALAFCALSGVVGVALWRTQADQTQRINTLYKEISTFNMQKDSLTRTLAEATGFISDVYQQVSAISGEVAVSNTIENIDKMDYKAQIATKLQRISSTVNNYKAQMQSAEEQLQRMKQQNAALASQVAVLEQTVGRLKTITEQQQQKIQDLLAELEMTRAEREKYKRQAVEAMRSLFETKEKLNTAYYIAGTVDELQKKGIIEKKGTLLFLGGAWQPVANLADSAQLTSQFKQVNIERDTKLNIPFQSYKIISAHNPRFTSVAAGEANVSPYVLRINRPEKFWAQSKYLIVVEW